MNIKEARKSLDDSTFLVGPFRRSSALKELAATDDPAAAEALVSAVDSRSPSAEGATEILSQDRRQAWADRMWELWSAKRQAWLVDVLRKRGAAFSRPDCAVGILSRLVVGVKSIATNAATADQVVAFIGDADKQVKEAAGKYLDGLKKQAPGVWVGTLLRKRLFDMIGKGRVATDAVAPFLNSTDTTLVSHAQACVAKWPVTDRSRALLLAQKGDTLTLDRETAFAVAELRNDDVELVSGGVRAYLTRALASEEDFVIELAFKSGSAAQLPASVITVSEALRLLRGKDAAVTSAVREWLGKLPRDQRYHDVIVDDWLRTDDAFLGKLLRDGQRFPSDAGHEVLLRLLWGDASGYVAMDDTDGRYLAEALVAANEGRRAGIVKTIQGSRDGALADRFRRASLKVQGMDTGLAIKTLQASGDEDRLVDAVREMTGAELFEQCSRWAESGRRPTDPKRRDAVDRAVALLKNQPTITIEPAPALPAGTEDVLAMWASDSRPVGELRADLANPDPFIRAGAMFALAQRGDVEKAQLNEKASSADWPERLAATLAGAEVDVSNDHVYWVSLCAGLDEGTHQAKVACGPDEFEVSAQRLATLREAKTPLARRTANELEVLQIFRALSSRGELVVSPDDSSDVRGAAQDGGVATW